MQTNDKNNNVIMLMATIRAGCRAAVNYHMQVFRLFKNSNAWVLKLIITNDAPSI
jgi:hypothetical protein